MKEGLVSYKDDELLGQVDPVYLETHGRLFLQFNAGAAEHKSLP